MSAGMAQGQRDLELVSRTLETLIERSGRQVLLLDRPAGVTRPVSAELASAPVGLLPVFLVAADTVWRDATGRGLGIRLVRDPQSLFGHRAVDAGGPFSLVMLSMMEAIEQVALPGEIPIEQLRQQWQATAERLDEAMALAARPAEPGTGR